MSADTHLDELLDSVADGDEIDWAALEAVADPEIRALLAHLKTVAGVAGVHRTPTDDDETGPVVVPTIGPAFALGELGRWGHLQLVRKVGEGSYGEVYHARDTWLDHPVALKLLRADLSDRVAPTKLLDEARVLVKVRHPNVVAVHGADLQQGRVGFWMEFVQGQRLDDVVAFQGLLSAEETAAIGQELCSALAAVHDAGLVHRDVKAQNVIREPKGRVVLMDFGAGQLIADAVGGAGAGTPLYLAPEMFADAPASVQTDIYALGVLLYYLVTGGYPVPARSIDELKDAHARGRQRPLLVARPGLPRGFVTVVEKMLRVDPAERYQTANEALAGLKRFTAPASILHKAGTLLALLLAGALTVTVLGLLNTSYFNLVLGRSSAFHNENGLRAWFGWGLSSVIAPVFYTGAWGLLLTLLSGSMHLLRKLWGPLDRAMSSARHRLATAAAERGLDDPTMLFQLNVGASAIALALLACWFWDYGAGMLTGFVFINEAPSGWLNSLQPANEYRVDLYGRLLDLLLLLFGVVAYRSVSWARRTQTEIPRAAKISALMVPIAILVLWQLPYRLMYHSAFERVDFDGTRCYAIGSNAADVLLHCPDEAPPRNRRVPAGDTRLHDRGVAESIFAPPQRNGGAS
jgi:hypothetical protein